MFRLDEIDSGKRFIVQKTRFILNCNGITPFFPPWFHYLTLFLKFNYLTLSFYVTGLDELLWFACFLILELSLMLDKIK
jgi:hypothetical protein